VLIGAFFIARKEYLHIVRDARTLILLLLMPAVLTVLFGYALETGVLRHIPSGVLNEDETPESHLILTGFRAAETFDIQDEFRARAEADRALAEGRVKVVIVVPRGFGRRIQGKFEAEVEMLLDGTDNHSAPLALEAGRRTVEAFNRGRAMLNLLDLDLSRASANAFLFPVTVKSEIRYNPSLDYTSFIMPGVIGLTLQLLTVMLMAMTITREREQGTMDQLIVTPMTRLELFVGKLIPYLVLSLVNVVTVLAIARFWFLVPFGGHGFLLGGICLAFVLSSLATGLLISALSATQFQAIQVAVFYVLPVFLLSGAYAPIEAIPTSIRWISYAFPLTYFARALRAVTLRGADLSVVWRDLTILAAFGIVMLYWSVISFHKRIA
jgi:ABC-2 type transport system permease protein